MGVVKGVGRVMLQMEWSEKISLMAFEERSTGNKRDL